MALTHQQAAERLAALITRHSGSPAAAEDMQQVAAGASGRFIMRSQKPEHSGLLGICWTTDRADNLSYVPAARGLAKGGVRVPALLAEVSYGEGEGACLSEDLGTHDLLSLKGAPEDELALAYEEAMKAVIPLHRTEPDWELQPAFTAEMYRWEQNYFIEHLLGRHLGMAQAAVGVTALTELADELAALPRCPVHRDFQSQNIMLRGGEAWLIDFQGMRAGRAEYDLASLLYDPYMDLSEALRARLLRRWEELTGEPLRADIFYGCALQRIMQALGAFANIGYNMKKDWYLSLIPTGLRILRQVAAGAPVGSTAGRVAAWLQSII